MKWTPLDIPENLSKPALKMVLRLNALGSLYFFAKNILGRDRLSNFHRSVMGRLESDRPRYLLEAPRDHYKTVMVTEARNMWRALPFNEADEAAMRELGYDDAYIAWMKRTHNPARRTLTVSEILENAVKIGFRIDYHYHENNIFKWVFSDIIPDKDCTWNNETKQQKCVKRGPQGEGTFDYLGVGGALQSRHYHDVYEDDVVGKEALESELVMTKTHDYHRLLIGAFERYSEASWVVVNNRWSPTDLSSWIRTNQPEFYIESHSALGGCCDEHPPGTPIFPEEFSLETLAEIRRVQGPYFFSHQYLNLPINPEECIFNKDWLRFYAPVKSPHLDGRHWFHHEVTGGEAPKDTDPRTLVRSMVVDPNHAEEHGRCHHGILVTGLDPETDRIYLLDVWAKSASYDELVHNIFRMAKLWGLTEFWLETNAAQRLLRYPVEYMNKSGFTYEGQHVNYKLSIRELKADRGANAKRVRIESLEPLFREHRFWVRRDQEEFLEEYYNYPGGRTVDVLDCLGYATQTWNAIHAKNILHLVQERKAKWKGYHTDMLKA